MNNEPVAYRHLHEDGWEYYDAPTGKDCVDCEPLYFCPFIEGWKCSAPPCKCDITNFKVCCYSSYTHPAKTLTDEEIKTLKEIIRITDRKHDLWDKAKEFLK